MTRIANELYKGKIVFWTQKYGFIESDELSEPIFFHKSQVAEKDKLGLLDIVSFEKSIVEGGKFSGRAEAINIDIIRKGEFNDVDRRIGTVYKWNSKFGFIRYPTDGKQIILFQTRVLYNQDINNGDLIVFNPVRSNKDSSMLFAFFGYPISFEKDVTYMKEQYANFQIPDLKKHILNYASKADFPYLEFELDLIDNGFVSNNAEYVGLVKLIEKYKASRNFNPTINVLEKYISNHHLIQLWESDLIKEYNISLLKDYFVNANANTKRFIISKINKEDDNLYILEHYLNQLENSNKLNRLNNDIKTLLDIVFRNETKIIEPIYSKIKTTLINTLNPNEILELWLYGYIDGIGEKFIISNFELGNLKSVKQLIKKSESEDGNNYKELLLKIYEQYFVNIANQQGIDFEKELPRLVKYLHVLENEFKERYVEIVSLLKVMLQPSQRMILWALGVNIEVDDINLIKDQLKELNHYYRIKLILRYKQVDTNCDLNDLVGCAEVCEGELKKLVSGYEWNEIVYPTEILDEEEINSLLVDVDDFNRICNFDININELADIIYNSVPPYELIHLRLWLYHYNDREHYSYIGFNRCFKQLNHSEQKLLRSKANLNDLFDVKEGIIQEILPCRTYECDGSVYKYTACVANIYFESERLRLRLENGEFTKIYDELQSSIGLNNIPLGHELNKLLLTITVEDNKIIEIIGLDLLFARIHTGEILKALSKPGSAIEDEKTTKTAYIEDWKLRKRIIQYLNDNQHVGVEIKIVHEPKNYRRRLDEKGNPDIFEKTALYTLKVDDGFAIVWENIDLSEDRATYIFKCSEDHYHTQIKKIENAIVSFAQLRSTLISSNTNPNIELFKRYYGFIQSIRKDRGKENAFSLWEKRFLQGIAAPVAEIPPISEEELLNSWEQEMKYGTAHVRKSSVDRNIQKNVLKEAELETVTFHESRSKPEKKRVEDKKVERNTKVPAKEEKDKKPQYIVEDIMGDLNFEGGKLSEYIEIRLEYFTLYDILLDIKCILLIIEHIFKLQGSDFKKGGAEIFNFLMNHYDKQRTQNKPLSEDERLFLNYDYFKEERNSGRLPVLKDYILQKKQANEDSTIVDPNQDNKDLSLINIEKKVNPINIERPVNFKIYKQNDFTFSHLIAVIFLLYFFCSSIWIFFLTVYRIITWTDIGKFMTPFSLFFSIVIFYLTGRKIKEFYEMHKK